MMTTFLRRHAELDNRSVFRIVTEITIGLLAVLAGPAQWTAATDVWKQWRGDNQVGVAVGDAYPIKWSPSEAVAWSIDLPGIGASTPVISQGRALLTAGVDGQNRLMCLDAATGKTVWSARLGTDRGGKHRKASGANSSPVTDGSYTYAYFRSGDLGCVDNQGNIRWQKNLQAVYGEDTLWWDLGTSPLLTENAVVIAVMQSGPSYLVALDKLTGKVLWKTDRMLDAPEEAAHSYSSPLLVQVGDQRVIAVLGADHVTLHNENDGAELARLGGFNPTGQRYFRSIASPVVQGDIIACPYARGSTITGVSLAAMLTGKGKEAIRWFRDDIGADVPTPAAMDGHFFVCSDKGVVTALDAESGKNVWQVELPRSRHAFSSSPLIAGDYIYLTREDAVTFVVGPLSSSSPKLVATNEIDNAALDTVASIVPIDGDLLLRTRESLYRLSRSN
jgi:outer membrane protein assembly factor BamB